MELFLQQLALEDIHRATLPSAAVDVCVAFLLKNGKFVEAMEVTNENSMDRMYESYFVLYYDKLIELLWYPP